MNITTYLEQTDDWVLSYDPSRVNVRTLEPEPSYQFNEYVADNPITMMEAVIENNLLAVAKSLAPDQPDPIRDFLNKQFKSPGESWTLFDDYLHGSKFYRLTFKGKGIQLYRLSTINSLDGDIRMLRGEN